MTEPLPVIVLGGSGYVAGELLRLIATHPRLHLGAVVSTSQVGKPLAARHSGQLADSRIWVQVLPRCSPPSEVYAGRTGKDAEE